MLFSYIGSTERKKLSFVIKMTLIVSATEIRNLLFWFIISVHKKQIKPIVFAQTLDKGWKCTVLKWIGLATI